jgi:hypothetical protein
VLLDRPSGAERRRLPLGRFARAALLGLASTCAPTIRTRVVDPDGRRRIAATF